MSIRRRPSSGYQARVMIDGRPLTATLPTREEARHWQRVVRARAVTGMLPRRTTGRDYAAHWIVGDDTAPANTRTFHEVNLVRILEVLGSTRVSEVTLTDITRLINQLITQRSAVSSIPPSGVLGRSGTVRSSARVPGGGEASSPRGRLAAAHVRGRTDRHHPLDLRSRVGARHRFRGPPRQHLGLRGP
jgi:hypothetical protein